MDDEDLKRVLKAWTTPSPGPALDRTVRESWMRSTSPRQWRMPLLVTAAALLAVVCVLVMLEMERTRQERIPALTRVVTDGDLSGFVPIREIHVSVERRKLVR